ncbi:hypothetical protein ACFLXC_04135 [Chloroflexota bacterium]
MNIEEGKIFWDLPSQVNYAPGSELACVFYVANPTSSAMRYSLNAELFYKAYALERETIPVDGFESFTVEAGDFITIRGTLRFNESNAELHVALVEANSGEILDTVSANLVYTSALQAYSSPVRPTADVFDIVTSVVIPLALIGMLGMTVAEAAKEV